MRFKYKKYNIFVGDYGSGKTEISINVSKYIKQNYNKNVIHIDMDIVNPYFRSGEKKKELNELGIEVIMPNFELSNVDVPSLPSTINKAFINSDNVIVFDVGGDETGAAALGQFSKLISSNENNYEIYMVINPFRPLTNNLEDTILMINQIELRSRLKITNLINNANVSTNTEINDIIYGHKFVDDLSKRTGIPLIFSTVNKKYFNELPDEIKNNCFLIETFMRPEWL